MKPEKQLFAFSIVYLFAIFRRARRRRLAAAMIPDPVTEEVRRRQRGRAIVMALGLAAFVVLIYFITIAKMAAFGG